MIIRLWDEHDKFIGLYLITVMLSFKNKVSELTELFATCGSKVPEINNYLSEKAKGKVLKSIKFDNTESCIEHIKRLSHASIKEMIYDSDEGSYFFEIEGSRYYLDIGDYVVFYDSGAIDVEWVQPYISEFKFV